MTNRKRGPWIVGMAAFLVLAVIVIAYAWIDGGRRPVRTIVQTVRPQTASGPAAAAGTATR